MGKTVKIESSVDGTVIEYEIEPEIIPQVSELDSRIESLESKISEINDEQVKYVSEIDWLDYTVSAGSGLLCSVIGSIFIGKFSLEKANLWGTEKTNQFVKHIAKLQGYKGSENNVDGAVNFLSNKYHLASDSNTPQFGGGLQHHLRDFSHHPTLVGLIFSLLTQFTGNAYGTDVTGRFIIVPVKQLKFIGRDIPQKLLFGVIFWAFHMVSDVAGSGAGTIGTGIPGPIGSLLKELSALPLFKKTDKKGYREFSVWVSKLFNGTKLKTPDGKNIRFDLRTEIGIAHEIGKQSLPVLANECIVRGFYFINRFICEIKKNNIHSFSELKRISPENIIPINNRSIARMVTVSSGSFVAGNCAYAAIMAAKDTVSSGAAANPYSAAGTFATSFLLRVNYVGVIRFAVAGITDISMGIKDHKLYLEKGDINNQLMFLKEAKIFYKQGESWKRAKNVDELIDSTSTYLSDTIEVHRDAINNIESAGGQISSCFGDFTNNNPEFAEDIQRLL